MIIPCAFFGKEKHKGSGSTAFISDGKRLTSSQIKTLAVIKLQGDVKGEDAKTTYAILHDKIGASSRTCAKNLKSMTEAGFIKKSGQSAYSIDKAFTSDDFIPVYDFLITEPIELGGSVSKKLSDSALFLLCNMIKHALNPKKKKEYYTGGYRTQAAFLNASETTGRNAIAELIAVGALTRGCVTVENDVEHFEEDDEGRGVCGGCNLYEQTGYIVNKTLINRCRNIQKRAKWEKERLKSGKGGAEPDKDKQAQHPAEPGKEELKQHIRCRRRRQSLGETFSAAIERARARARDKETYRNLYIKLEEEERGAGPPPDGTTE